MAATIEKFKQYLRIDTDYENELLQGFLDTAEAYLQGAINNYDEKCRYSEFASKADILQCIIAAELYQNRDGRNDLRNDYSFTVRSMLVQLQYFVMPKAVHDDEDYGQLDKSDFDGRLDGKGEDNLPIDTT